MLVPLEKPDFSKQFANELKVLGNTKSFAFYNPYIHRTGGVEEEKAIRRAIFIAIQKNFFERMGKTPPPLSSNPTGEELMKHLEKATYEYLEGFAKQKIDPLRKTGRLTNTKLKPSDLYKFFHTYGPGPLRFLIPYLPKKYADELGENDVMDIEDQVYREINKLSKQSAINVVKKYNKNLPNWLD